MKHLDPTVLALAALGEPLDGEQQRHLDECHDCAAEVSSLARVRSAARGGTPVTLESPGPDVWERVHRELGLPPHLASDPLGGDAARLGNANDAGAQPTDGAQPTNSAPAADGAAAAGGAGVSQLDSHSTRRRAPLWLAAAAAAGIIIGGGAVWGVNQWDGTDPDGEVLAETELAPLPGYQSSGEATITEGNGGTRTLAVSAQDGQSDGYREVWLISEDLEQMYSLGVLAGDKGNFAIPDGVELSQFPIVDISAEPTDGNPEHSGDSILRGTLPGGG